MPCLRETRSPTNGPAQQPVECDRHHIPNPATFFMPPFGVQASGPGMTLGTCFDDLRSAVTGSGGRM